MGPTVQTTDRDANRLWYSQGNLMGESVVVAILLSRMEVELLYLRIFFVAKSAK